MGGRNATNPGGTVNQRPTTASAWDQAGCRSADLIRWQAIGVFARRIVEYREVMATFVLVDTGATQGADDFLVHRTQLMGCTKPIERLDQQRGRIIRWRWFVSHGRRSGSGFRLQRAGA